MWLKKAAAPYLDDALITGASRVWRAEEEWFREGDFGARVQAAGRSKLPDEAFRRRYVQDLLRGQMEGRGGYSFPVDDHERCAVACLVDRGREDCL